MKTNPGLQFSLLLAFIIVLSGCDSDAPIVVEQNDPWLKAPPASDVEPELVPPDSFAPVIAERIAEAEEFLEEIGTSQISPSEVPYFTGKDLVMPDVTRPFLIRGLYRTKSSYTISIVGNALWVVSGDDPSDNAPLKRQPLVLIMREVPELVYVTTGR